VHLIEIIKNDIIQEMKDYSDFRYGDPKLKKTNKNGFQKLKSGLLKQNFINCGANSIFDVGRSSPPSDSK